MVKITFEIKPEDIDDFIAHTIRYDRNYMRNKFLWGLVIPFVLLWIFWMDFSKTWFDMILVLILILIGLWLYRKWVDYMFWRKKDKIKQQWQQAGLFDRPIQLIVDGRTLKIKTSQGEGVFDLSKLYKIYETPKFLFVYLSLTKVIIIPKDRVVSGDVEKFKQELLKFTRCR